MWSVPRLSTLPPLGTLILGLGLKLALGLPAQALAEVPAEEAEALWHYGAYLDLNYAPDLSTPRSVPFRDKLTTNRLNQFSPDLGMIYLRKGTTTESPFGFEISGQAGYDTNGQLPPISPCLAPMCCGIFHAQT